LLPTLRADAQHDDRLRDVGPPSASRLRKPARHAETRGLLTFSPPTPQTFALASGGGTSFAPHHATPRAPRRARFHSASVSAPPDARGFSFTRQRFERGRGRAAESFGIKSEGV